MSVQRQAMEKTRREARVCVLPGDGIGPEVIRPCLPVLETVGSFFGLCFRFEEKPVGGAAIDGFGMPLPPDTLDAARHADAVLLGAVGGPQWDGRSVRPEEGLLALRAELGLFCNLRPAVLYPSLAARSPLKDPLGAGPFDLVIVRELTGGLYYGARGLTQDGAYDTMAYSETEIMRIGRRAFDLAWSRRKRLVSVDKANVLETSRLWRRVMHSLREEYPDVAYEDMLVDNAAMQLIRAPGAFDVLVTENTFGDILSDEAGMLTGSIGLLPSASLGQSAFGLYEPVHGSAPDIAGKGMANPLAALLSSAMMLRFSFACEKAACVVERAVERTLKRGRLTADLTKPGDEAVDTETLGALVLDAARGILEEESGETS